MSYSKDELAKYRVARSKESLEEAKILSQSDHWNTVANRLYYGSWPYKDVSEEKIKPLIKDVEELINNVERLIGGDGS
ncbi:MAG: hypothetical protein DA408_16710 [Bacteroidetes bacterium]|nr:MAG: hypothetical protein C7N36_07090 [Bacteroidota bacterium]PTM10141.1 MAG: hypothetical protein DA408_16710 [Bacteroidota bacterium]